MEGKSAVARIRIWAPGRTYEGNVHVSVKPGGYRNRVSDILNESPAFLALTDVVVKEASPGAAAEPVHYDVILLRKGEITFVVPLA